jgi:hypothetical protein
MSAITAANPGLNDVLQSLSSLNSPIVSSPTTVSALEKAYTSDIVALSSATDELAGVNALFFGASDESSSTSNGTLASFLSDLPSNATPGEQLAAYQNSSQASQVDTLLGLGSGTSGGSLFNVTG